MRVSVLQDQLAAALTMAVKAIPNKPSLPILGNVLLYTEGSKLFITASDLEVSVRTSIGAKVDMHGAITLPAKTLKELVTNFSPERVDIDVDRETLTAKIKCGTTRTNIKGINADDYPPLPEIKSPDVMLPGDLLKERMKLVAFSAANVEMRPILTGILFEFDSTSLTLATADGYRLATTCMELEAAPTMTKIIPADIVKLVASAIDEDDAVGIQLFQTGNGESVTFHIGQTYITTFLLEGKFPDFRAILPKEWYTQVTVRAEDLLGAAKRAEIFARDSNFSTRMQIRISNNPNVTPSDLAFIGRSAERGDAETILDCIAEGEDIELAFNVRYLQDILNNIEDEEVQIEMITAANPIVVNSKAAKYLIMPMGISR